MTDCGTDQEQRRNEDMMNRHQLRENTFKMVFHCAFYNGEELNVNGNYDKKGRLNLPLLIIKWTILTICYTVLFIIIKI